MGFESNAASPGDGTTAASRVFEKLRASLAKLLGSAGFWALLSRAVTLAQAEARELGEVRAGAGGELHGLDGLTRRGEIVLVAHLLGLLVTFIGTALTLRLVHDLWPDADIDSLDQGKDS